MSEQPRPCPHCGGTDFLIADAPFGEGGKVLTCQDLYCFGRMWGTDEEDVITRWNRRTPGRATKSVLDLCLDTIKQEWGSLPVVAVKRRFQAFVNEWKAP